jgi:hypothetical protein
MNKSRDRSRRSFGGSHGVWWRNRKLPRVALSSEDEETAIPFPSLTEGNEEENELIGWDEDLCRPIYTNANENKLVSDDGNREEDDEEEDPPSKLSFTFNVPVRRHKSFGGRTRLPVSLELLEANREGIMSSTYLSPANSIPTSPGKTDEISGKDVVDDSSKTLTKSQDSLDFPGNCVDGDQNETNRKGKRKRKILKVEDVSILKAKRYFQQLDDTHTLNLDLSQSPLRKKSSKVIRTSRRINLGSPGITREYRSYAEAMSSGDDSVKPLTLVQYAHSRRDYFRHAEMYDGFFDDL